MPRLGAGSVWFLIFAVASAVYSAGFARNPKKDIDRGFHGLHGWDQSKTVTSEFVLLLIRVIREIRG
jgi:hypothetical protein